MTELDAFTWYEQPDGPSSDRVLAGRVDLGALPVRVPAKARAYLCGPIPFMRDVRHGLLKAGVSDERIHYEVFGPDLWQQND